MKYLKRAWLFLRIVWRPWEDFRIGFVIAWKVACIVWD
jgi:hypothetical protein